MLTRIEKQKDKNLIEQQGYKECSWIECKEKKLENGKVERKYTLNVQELAEYIKKNLNYFFVKNELAETSMLYIYSGGVYKNVSDDEFKAFIKKFIPYQLVKMREVDEIFKNIKTEFNNLTFDDLNTNENLINFEDGLLDLNTMELKEHTPEIYSTIQIPAKYKEIEEATEAPEVFENYMMTLVNNDVDVYVLLMKWIGLSISNIYGYRTKKALFLVGAGNTGKSQLKSLVEKLIGHRNISTIDLKSLSEKFGTSSIYGKRMVGCNDMSFQRVDDMSIFKQLTGGDRIMIEFKYGAKIDYLYLGTLWFNCNRMPLFGGDTGSWVYERIIPVFCENVIPKEKQDSHLLEKMYKEKNQILNEILFFLKKLIEDDYKIELPKKLIDYRNMYIIENNTLLSFIDECCDISEKEIISSLRDKKSEFKKIYYKWCDVNNYGKGKLKLKEIETTLKERYGEDLKKYDGYEKLKFIKIKKETYEELGIWREENK